MLTKNANNDTDTMLTIGILPIMGYGSTCICAS